MKFSIIVPTYNRADFLNELLDSLVKQTFEDFEVLVCDDGSTDHTKEIVETYKNKLNLRYFFEENWGGPARPRNIGIQNAKADWICFLDSDDLWYPQKLLTVSKTLDADRKADIIYHLFSTDKDKSVKIGNYRKSPFNSTFDDLLINGNKIVNSSLVIRKNLLKQVGYLTEDRRLIGVEDYDLTIRLAKAGARFVLINKILGHYRINDSNISADNQMQLEKVAYLLSRFESSARGGISRKSAALLNYLKGCDVFASGQGAKARSYLVNSLLSGSTQIKMKSIARICLSYLK